MRPVLTPKRKLVWRNIIFFFFAAVGGLIGAPIYILNSGISSAEVFLFLFFTAATGLSITVGYHRLFSHGTFKAHPIIRFFLLFFGAAAFEQSALDWSSQHRDHHLFVDTDRDPYSIKKGLFYAHIGWLLFWDHPLDHGNVKNLTKDPLIRHQHTHYIAWASIAGIALPVLIGSLTGHALGAFLLSVCLRLTLVYQTTFFINSICHMFGTSTYDAFATAKDNGWIALLTFGEGYHNFHHRFPGDYRNGVRWYQWDPSKWLIAVLSTLGLAWDLKRASHFHILEARLAGEKSRLFLWFQSLLSRGEIMQINRQVETHYQKVHECLTALEEATAAYQEAARKKLQNSSRELLDRTRVAMLDARRQFVAAETSWNRLRHHPVF